MLKKWKIDGLTIEVGKEILSRVTDMIERDTAEVDDITKALTVCAQLGNREEMTETLWAFEDAFQKKTGKRFVDAAREATKHLH